MSFLLEKFAISDLRGRPFSKEAVRRAVYAKALYYRIDTAQAVVGRVGDLSWEDQEALDRFMGVKPASDDYSAPPARPRAVR